MSILTQLDFPQQSYTSITSDSRKVQMGSIFLAYPGTQSDGRKYIPQAIEAGAAAVVWESKTDGADFSWNSDWQVKNVACDDLKHQAGQIAAEFYEFPSRKVTMIGVTGTNGKTSVSQWIAQCLTELGKTTAVIGTIGNGLFKHQTAAANTTPDAIMLQEMLAEFVANNAEVVVMEVSSHGLDQGRVNAVEFDCAVFTNLSRDHLDYHHSMEAYAEAKQKLFEEHSLQASIINVDDTFGSVIAENLMAQGKRCVTYGFEKSDIHATSLVLHKDGLQMKVTVDGQDYLLSAAVLGRFNAYNLLAVLATLLELKVNVRDAIAAMASIKSVQGRMQQIGGADLPLVVIDYAHTPDALDKVLSTLREHTSAKLICVFGCGGNRDKGKRPLMGSVVSHLADVVLITNDNPRNEDPAAIIREITVDMHVEYQVEMDRALAIEKAVNAAVPGDIVLIAGKGHENYQEIAGVKYSFDDMEVARAALSKYQVSNMGKSA